MRETPPDPRFAVSIIGHGKQHTVVALVDGHSREVERPSRKLKHRLVIVQAGGEAGAASLAKEDFARDYPDFEVWSVLVEPTKEQ